MNVNDAIKSRSSTRAFLDKPVSRKTLETIFEIARWSPSGGNLQPWKVVVVTGESKQRIGDEIISASEAGVEPHPEYPHYPDEWFEPYKSRRKASGIALYQAMGIKRDDMQRRKEAWYRNYRFFDAPVGLLFFMDKRMPVGSWVNMGLFLQSIMLAASEHGLATCPQFSLADYPEIIRNIVSVTDEFALVCGMSLGYADENAEVNNYRTQRADINEFVTWCD